MRHDDQHVLLLAMRINSARSSTVAGQIERALDLGIHQLADPTVTCRAGTVRHVDSGPFGSTGSENLRLRCTIDQLDDRSEHFVASHDLVERRRSARLSRAPGCGLPGGVVGGCSSVHLIQQPDPLLRRTTARWVRRRACRSAPGIRVDAEPRAVPASLR